MKVLYRCSGENVYECTLGVGSFPLPREHESVNFKEHGYRVIGIHYDFNLGAIYVTLLEMPRVSKDDDRRSGK